MDQSKIESGSKISLMRPYILAAVMLAMFQNAIEGTIVSTAMLSSVNELCGFSH